MKRLYTLSKFKRYNQARSNKAMRARMYREERTYNPFRSDSYVPVVKKSPIANVQAPEHYSIIYNTIETLNYFNDIRDILASGQRVRFDLTEVRRMTTDAIAVQIAKIKDERYSRKVPIFGNAPKEESLSNLFLHSGFYDHVRVSGAKPASDNKLIHEITANRVEPDIAKDACLLGINHTFKNSSIFEPLYDIIIEVMQNTNNHAGKTRGMYDWWLHVYNHPSSSKTSYTFLDLGSGIFKSLPVRTFWREAKERLHLASNLDLVERLFAGEIKSRTSRPERGKGIPQIYECAQDKVFTKFILVSNDIFFDLKTRESKLLSTKFDGTLFYWEIDNVD